MTIGATIAANEQMGIKIKRGVVGVALAHGLAPAVVRPDIHRRALSETVQAVTRAWR
jgi:hypothetical protein